MLLLMMPSSRNSLCQTMHKLGAARRHIRSHQHATNASAGVPLTASYPQNHHSAPAANLKREALLYMKMRQQFVQLVKMYQTIQLHRQQLQGALSRP